MSYRFEDIFVKLYKVLEIDKYNYNTCKNNKIRNNYKRIFINRSIIVSDIIDNIKKTYVKSELTKDEYIKEVSNINEKLYDDCNLNRELDMDENQLSKYNGIIYEYKYIAINGIIYDVTDTPFIKAPHHQGIMFGKDLTNYFQTYHGKNFDILNKLPVVGKLKKINEK